MVNPSLSVVYKGLVASTVPFDRRVVPPGGGTPITVIEEVARGTKGLEEVDRLLVVCPKHREESLLMSSR